MAPRRDVPESLAPSQPNSTAQLDAIVRHEIEVIGSFAGSMSEAIGALAANAIDVVSLISRRLPLRDGVAAIKSASQAGTPSILLTSEE